MLVPPSGSVTWTREPVGCTSSMTTGTRAWPAAARGPAMADVLGADAEEHCLAGLGLALRRQGQGRAVVQSNCLAL